MTPKSYNKYVTDTVGDGKIYHEIKINGVFFSEDPPFITAAPISIETFESQDAVGVGSCAFADCCELVTVSLPNIKIIDEFAFSQCKKLSNFPNMSQVVIMRDCAFWETNLEEVDLSSLITVPFGGLSECRNLKTVKLCENTRSICENAFSGCLNLAEIELPKNVNYIGPYAFFNTGLRTISIPKGVRAIQEGTFALCEQLSSVKIPAGSVESIESYAFGCCPNLTRLYIPRSVKKISSHAFINDYVEAIICHKGSFAERWAKGKGFNIEYVK